MLSAPTGAPTFVGSSASTISETNEGTVTTTSQIERFWSRPTCGERNGEITGYTYSFRRRFINVGPPLDMDYNNVFTDEISTYHITSVLFRNLAPNVEYTFEIAAHNAIGVGPMDTTNPKTPAGRKLFDIILISGPCHTLYTD